MKDKKIDYSKLASHLKKVADTFNEDYSMSDMLDKFRLVSKEYQESIVDSDNSCIKENALFETADTEDRNALIERLQSLECLVTNSIYDKEGFIYTWNNIFGLIHDPVYSTVQKTYRKVVFSTSCRERPIGDKSYEIWNGLQIIDLDIKDEKLSDILKPLLFKHLSKYKWFLGVCKSASGRGLHVWTKITPITASMSKRKIEFLCNYRQKYSYVYIILSMYASKYGYTQDDIMSYMDMAMAKPQQGIFITSDKTAMMSVNFYDQRLDANFEPALDTGIESINWISHPALREIFSKLEWFNRDTFNKSSNIKASDISNINERDRSKSHKKHYKHAQRWQLANTLTALYGFDKAFEIMCDICDGTSTREIRSDVKTASIHKKPISVWAVRELNRHHGFSIKVDGEDSLVQEGIEEKSKKVKDNILNNDILNNDIINNDIINNDIINNDNISGKTNTKASNKTVITIKKDQYLSDVKDEILSNLSSITLLEAGAGYGKTEMIKAFKAKTLLILPFTSTIKAKVEKSETTADWLYYYGNKKPTLDDILSKSSMSMTIDKFSRLNVMELDMAGFEYIVLDESHLLFTSSYRDVMAPAIQRLANCKAKVIMMTGTPTGELLFFPDIKHIKVVKEDVRMKDVKIFMCPTSIEQLVEMCKSMADDIINGTKILYPTNRGNLYFEQVTGIIQNELDNRNFGRGLRAFYYKKSNYGDNSMDEINIDKSVGENDIVFCTTYLSVGVDICDHIPFAVYFNEQWIPQDIEQFANRLRNNDLYLKMFLPKKDSDGIPYNYSQVNPLDLTLNTDDMVLARDLIKTCNDMIERNQEESKYNPIIQSILSVNKYLKYDENDCHYYIDETTYKLHVFEERYAEYSKQLPVMMAGIRHYGYTVQIVDKQEEVPDDKKDEVVEFLKSVRSSHFNAATAETFKFIDHVTEWNIDIYRELIQGNYAIFKDKEYEDVRKDNDLYIDNIEILEKNIPIVLSLFKFYDVKTIHDIYEYCVDGKQNRINFSKLARIRKFVAIESNRQKRRVDFPVIKFIREAQKWASTNPDTTKDAITEFKANWAARYANSIPGLIVDDIAYFDQIYNYINDLWNVIVISENRSHSGTVHIKPFELLWEKKTSMSTLYNNSETDQFFLKQLIDEMHENEDFEVERKLDEDESYVDGTELPHTEKFKLDDVKDDVMNTINKAFDYKKYSSETGSNDKFMEQMKKQNSLRGTLFEELVSNDDVSYMSEQSKDIEQDMFELASAQ